MIKSEADQPPFFHIHCEMQDVANGPQMPTRALHDLPAAMTLELAKLMHACELHIGDEDRARLIEFGGWLLQLHGHLERNGDALGLA